MDDMTMAATSARLRRPPHRRLLAAALIFGALCLSAAHAQFDAGRQANLMHQHELMRKQSTGKDGDRAALPEQDADSPDRGAGPLRPAPASAAAGIEGELAQMMQAHMRELGPEYEHRLRVHGRDDANAWLRQVATEAGRRDGEALRARLER